jgi:EpsD family peptidyl-prolyl cis-trans isomerase
MTNSTRGLLLAASACLILAGCGQKPPSGQVVATVKGKEVTSIELNNELNGFQAPNAQIRKAAEMQALNGILVRKVLAQAAEKAGIGKTPGFAQQEQRLHETLLIQDWQAQITKAVPPPSHEEVEKFVAEHPDMYAARKIFEVDQLRFPRSNDPNVIKGLQPLKTLEAVEALMTANKIPFRTGRNEIDALTVDPNVVAQIVKLPPGEVFIVPSGNVLVANRIVNTRVEPVVGDAATQHATAFLKAQRTQEAIRRQFGAVLARGKKDIVYSKAYQPPAPPKAAGATAPATPAKK